MFGRALRRRCPHCAPRGIFKNYFNMKEHCPTCSLALDRGSRRWVGIALAVIMPVAFYPFSRTL